MATSTDLAVVNEQNAVQIFTKGGLNDILEEVEIRVRSFSLDISTASGRDEIRSLAYKVVRTKTALDAEAKRLTEGWRDATKKVNAERTRAQERLDSLAEEVRRPLTEFENKDKIRIAAHEAALAEIIGMSKAVADHPDMSLDLLVFHQADLRELHANRNWEEFAARAQPARSEADKYISGRLESRKRFEVEQEELARLRKAEAERRQREHDEKIKAEAAESARLEAESKAKKEADAEAKRVIEAAEVERKRVASEAARLRLENERKQQAAEDARLREESAKLAALKKVKDAEDARASSERKAKADKEAAEAKAAADLKAAQDKAKRDADEAVARERARVERERKTADDARLKREADERLRAKIHREIADDCAEKSANEIATAIMAGKVRHVAVSF